MGDIIDDIHLLFFEVNSSSIATVIDSCTSTQQGTPSIPTPTSMDDFLANISSLFLDSYIEDLGDIIDYLHLLFDGEDPSPFVVRGHSDPLVHSLHDSFHKFI